jgi:hypothetical protein
MPVFTMQFVGDEGAYAARLRAEWRRRAGRGASAKHVQAAIVALHRSDPSLALALARALLARRRLDVEAARQAASFFLASARSLAKRLGGARRRKLLEESVAAARHLGPDFLANTRVELADALRDLSRIEAAVEAYRRCVADEPADSPFARHARSALEKLGVEIS